MPITIEHSSPHSIGKRPHPPSGHFAKPPEASETRPDDDSATLEQVVVKTCGVESLEDLPVAVAQNIIAIDAFDFPLSLEDRRSLLAYSLYVLHEKGEFTYIRTYLKVTEAVRINALIDPVMDDETLTDDYKEVDDLKGILESFPFSFNRLDLDRRKKIAKEVVRLRKKEVPPAEIIARGREILYKTHPNRLSI